MPIHKAIKIIREAKHHISVVFESFTQLNHGIVVHIYTVDIEEGMRNCDGNAKKKMLVGFMPAVIAFGLSDGDMDALTYILSETSCSVTLVFDAINLFGFNNNVLATLVGNIRHLRTLKFSNISISHAQMEPVIAPLIKKAPYPFTLVFESVALDGNAANVLAETVKNILVPITLYVEESCLASCESLIEALKEARVPIDIVFDGVDGVDQELYNSARQDNFVVEARANPQQFLTRLGFSMVSLMLDKVLYFCPQDIIRLIQSYISYADLAWSEVLAIRDVEGASHDNKYSSINTTALTSRYFPQDKICDKNQYTNTESKLGYFLKAFSELLSVESNVTSAETLPNWFLGRETLIKFLTLMPSGVTPPMVIPYGFINVPGDGLCFYHAAALQLGTLDGLALQREAVNEILVNYQLYKDFLEDNFWGDNLESPGKDNRGWAEHVMIQAVANMLHRPIEIRRFDLDGTENTDLMLILPRELNPDYPALKLGNIANLHFVAANDTQLTEHSSAMDISGEDTKGHEDL